MGTAHLEETPVFLAVYPGLPQQLKYHPRKTGKAGECEQISGEMAHCLELGVTAASLSAPLQVKLSGSHLTPQCYSFITYVQVRPKLTGRITASLSDAEWCISFSTQALLGIINLLDMT